MGRPQRNLKVSLRFCFFWGGHAGQTPGKLGAITGALLGSPPEQTPAIPKLKVFVVFRWGGPPEQNLTKPERFPWRLAGGALSRPWRDQPEGFPEVSLGALEKTKAKAIGLS